MNLLKKKSILSGVVFGVIFLFFNLVVTPMKNHNVILMILYAILASFLISGYVYWYGTHTKLGKRHFEKKRRDSDGNV